MTENAQLPVKATLYTTTESFGNVVKREITLLTHGFQKYAQYDKAPFVEYIPKGKRKPVKITKGYKPTILILSGHGHPEPEDLYVVVDNSEGHVTVSKTKYFSFDERLVTDFDATIDVYIESGKGTVLADYRYTKNK